ncbi:Transporter [Operophtera brumata]|uniref:Transporter n=1 Tax=Operophtera brumata TaxID=104452 RepID=A0A0L7LJI6_OPEBR|nr:Transporter [Operophtera brumata]
MKNTSQDGGDLTTATSGIENEIKKPKAGLLSEFKSKKLGKRTAPNLSEESDDAVVEPLLQKNTNTTSQSAKYFAKAKADTVKEISKLFNDKKSQYASTSGFGTTETLLSEKDQVTSKTNPSSNAPVHNYMNTNIFHSHDNSNANGTTKSELLVEINGSKQSGYNPSPLIFTTAKIHTDGKLKNMEPVQMTPAPILSTLEVSVSKGGSITTNEKKVSNGTSVLNTIYPQPQVNEKSKENTVNISNSNVIPVTQSKDSITGKPANPSKPFTTSANNPIELIPHISEKTKEITVNISKSNIAPATQCNMTVKTDNLGKSITTLSNNPLVLRPSPETLKSMNPVNVNDKPGKTKDSKMLVDEPRIVMSESKLKSTISDKTKTSVSVKTTKDPQTSLPKQNEKFKFDENKTRLELDTKLKNKDIKETQELLNKNVKAPSVANEFPSNSFNTNSPKTLHQQKNNPTEVSNLSSKTEIKTDSSKKPECSEDSSAKTPSSTKITTQSKVIDSKLSKEIDKSPKPSANEITKSNPKISLNNSATLSSNKMTTSSSVVKPAPSVSSSHVVSSTIGDNSNKTLNKSSLNNSKAINSTVAATTVSSSATKTHVTITKTATSMVNTKPASVTSTKSSTKPSSASSVKSPQIPSTPTIAAKQTNTSTSKTTSSKPPSIPSTKTPQVNISSPNVTTPPAKPFVSKIAQVSTSGTSKPTRNASSSASSSTSTVDAKNNTKTKAPESDKKGGSKLSDHTKDTKVSKA